MMKALKYKKWYLILSFILSLYLVVVTIIGFTSISPDIKKPLDQIAHYVLWYFVIELIVIFILTKDFKRFIKEQWISILAIVSSLSVTMLADAFVGIGSLTGLKAFKSVKAIKSLKGLKSIKLFKATKGVKVVKSYKIGKKVSKTAKKIDDIEQNG